MILAPTSLAARMPQWWNFFSWASWWLASYRHRVGSQGKCLTSTGRNLRSRPVKSISCYDWNIFQILKKLTSWCHWIVTAPFALFVAVKSHFYKGHTLCFTYFSPKIIGFLRAVMEAFCNFKNSSYPWFWGYTKSGCLSSFAHSCFCALILGCIRKFSSGAWSNQLSYVSSYSLYMLCDWQNYCSQAFMGTKFKNFEPDNFHFSELFS